MIQCMAGAPLLLGVVAAALTAVVPLNSGEVAVIPSVERAEDPPESCVCTARVKATVTIDDSGTCTSGGQAYPCISMDITSPQAWSDDTEDTTCYTGEGLCKNTSQGYCILGGVGIVLTPALCADDCPIKEAQPIYRKLHGGANAITELTIEAGAGAVQVDLGHITQGALEVGCGSLNYTSCITVEDSSGVIYKVQLEGQCKECKAKQA